MKPLTYSQYDAEVTNYPGSVLLFFTATWDTVSLPSRNFLQSTNLNIKLFSVDYDSERLLVDKFSVRNIPTIAFLKNGKVTAIAFECTTEAQLMAMFLS